MGYAISVGAFFVYQRIKMRQLAAEGGGKHGGGGGHAILAHAAGGAAKGGADGGHLPQYQPVPVLERGPSRPGTPTAG